MGITHTGQHAIGLFDSLVFGSRLRAVDWTKVVGVTSGLTCRFARGNLLYAPELQHVTPRPRQSRREAGAKGRPAQGAGAVTQNLAGRKGRECRK